MSEVALRSSPTGGETGNQPSVRERGGFRSRQLDTVPAQVTNLRATNMSTFRPADLMCNYVPIKKSINRELQMYRVDFEPKVESVETMRFLYRQATKDKFEKRPIYDGAHECRSGQKLQDKVTSITIVDERGENKPSYKITFTHTGSCTMGSEMLRTYNMHMKRFFHELGYFQPQPGLMVHPAQSFNVGDGIKILRGFRTAANVHDEGKLLMNFEASHKLIQQRNVREIMQQVRSNTRGSDFREAIKSEMIGKLVVTSYNKRAYRVEDVDFSSNPESKFKRSDGSEISYMDYFKNAYMYTVQDRQQPLLTVIPSNKRHRGDEDKTREIKLIPEMCNIAGLTEQQRNDNRLKMDLIRASQINPQDRVAHLRSFLKMFHENKEVQKHLEAWGYGYETDGFKLRGHIIKPTKIGMGQAAMSGFDSWANSNPETADFNVNALAKAPNIEKMAVIFGRGDLQSKGKIMANLKAGFQKVQLNVKSVEIRELEGDQASFYAREIRQLAGKEVTLAVIVLHGQNKACYDAIKKTATAEQGLITQVVTAKLLTDDRKARSAATKIAIQIAAKIGGEPWWVDMPLKGAMVCGYDTHHDTTNRGRSFGAFLASMNDRFSRWFSRADQHDKLDEMSTQVASNIAEALQAYERLNKTMPERIIVYRDGVSEGRIEHVFKNELKNISDKVAEMSPDQEKKIKLTMVLVNKQVGARFYMRAGEKFINPPPGTVVDHGVTRQNRFDFYLISQSTRQGTISPTYYNIIHDESGFGPEIHQKMAFKFTLLYYNWSGSVRVPAPCQYAHKLAQLCGEHIHAQPLGALNDRLHFL